MAATLATMTRPVFTIIAALALLSVPGCLKKELRHPAEDHYIQTRTVADSCQADGYGNGRCTKEDLEAMAEQARCIDAVIKGQACGGEEAGE